MAHQGEGPIYGTAAPPAGPKPPTMVPPPSQGRGMTPGLGQARPQGQPQGRPPSPPSPESIVKPIPRRGHLGPLSLTQILIAEGSILAIVAAATQGLIPALVATAAAAILLAVFFARRQNHWWLEHHTLTRDFRRRRGARREPDAGPTLAALRTIAPGLTIRNESGRKAPREKGSDEKTGIASDDSGWFGVILLDSPGPVPLATLITQLAATEQPGITLELVVHTVPAPSPDVPAASPAGASYRRLAETMTPIPAYRESSISVRIDAKTFAESVSDHTTDPAEATALTAALTRKIATSLRRLGIAGRVLDAREILELLARSCDVEPGSPVEAVAEEWTHWRSGHLVHRAYWLETWPISIADIGPLFAWAATAPAAQTTVALILDATRDTTKSATKSTTKSATKDVPSSAPNHATKPTGIAVRALLRLAARPDADLGALDRVLLEGVRRAGGELRPLDGEHGPATYATAPTGGGAG